MFFGILIDWNGSGVNAFGRVRGGSGGGDNTDFGVIIVCFVAGVCLILFKDIGLSGWLPFRSETKLGVGVGGHDMLPFNVFDAGTICC